MRKSDLIVMLLGTVSSVLFALGMCMALIQEWNSFKPGVVLGCAGILLGVITVMVWRRMKHKQPIHVSGKSILSVAVVVIGALGLGVGMCFSMVWDKMVLGIVIGLLGIVILMLGTFMIVRLRKENELWQSQNL